MHRLIWRLDMAWPEIKVANRIDDMMTANASRDFRPVA
jgi:hypothetical protein